ncbi:hypothetical protein AHF37_08712 [Paragonimus kellicotti]|nr:hypothetical protein AHF37_08712 [Paragonimus kellicotti]
MASQQFMDLYQRINVANQVGIEDSVDRLNLFTVVLFALAAVVVGVKQYIMNDISCYIPVSPTGDKFKEFVNDYCWVHGTIPLRLGEAMPNNDQVWNEYDKFRRITNQLTLEDFSDRLTLVTCVLFCLASTVVGVKQYVFNSISCYIPVAPDGQDFKDYLHSYCWVHGTIPLRANESLPKSEEQWDVYDRLRRVTYYQWVPFVLGLQCIFFYIPHIAWQAVCAHRSGGDLFALVKSAADAATSERGTREKQVKRVAEFLEDMIDGQRDCHKQYVFNPISCYIPVKPTGDGINAFITDYCWVHGLIPLRPNEQLPTTKEELIAYDKWRRISNQLTLEDFSDRLTLVTCVLFCLASTVVGVKQYVFNSISCYIPVAPDGQDFKDYLHSYCWVHGTIPLRANESLPKSEEQWDVYDRLRRVISTVSNENENFNGFGFGLTVANHIRSGRDWPETMLFPRVAYCRVPGIRLGVLSRETHQQISRSDLDDFIDEYLRRDGVFLVRMLALNAGEVITAEIVTVLYKDYLAHVDQHENGSTSVEDEKAALADGKGNPPSYV